VQPNSASACAKAVKYSSCFGSPSTALTRTPMRRICSRRCARAGSGHAAAALPRSAMKFRRLMQLPVEGQAYQRAALCVTAKLAAKCSDGSIASHRQAGGIGAMSALLRKRPVAIDMQIGRLVPKAAVSNRSKAALLFDHLIGGGKERRRYGEPEHAGGFGVDDEFELRRLYHGQVRGLRALENATYIAAELTIGVNDIGP